MRKYDVLYVSSTQKVFVIFTDVNDKEWLIYSEVDTLDQAHEIANALNSNQYKTG